MSYGNTALIYGAINGDVDCVKKLLKAGAYLNATNSYGGTGLMICAALNSDVHCV